MQYIDQGPFSGNQIQIFRVSDLEKYIYILVCSYFKLTLNTDTK